MRHFLILLFAAAVLLGSAACTKNDGPSPTNTYGEPTTAQYKTLPGTDANLLSLDMYTTGATTGISAAPRPVVIWVHGGGWRQGDKAQQLANKLSLFSSLDYVFVSVNYRLSPSSFELNNPNRIKFPDHNHDVADAVQWVFNNIGAHGGDPAKVVLLGHSAGAHLVSLTGTSPQFLPARGLALNRLKGVASIDTDTYDLTGQGGEDIYQNAFGNDPATLRQASPMTHVAAGTAYPRFFVAKRGAAGRVANANAFISQLQAAGTVVSQVDGSRYDHEGVNNAIGEPNETVVTPALRTFLEDCFQ
ncbi:alpha/beta hydrolase [Hymenobacter sp.]|uniref:alpha/beta hydrolase n=1 Tax=Hymenobacter sp. TaxID=1898978 RepID=UPI00286ADBE7|nr:alpha/beta hydrolase [Hymenobacter sp.]